ncbi:site-specific integrase [Caldanaerobacter subterraneus]|uniref:Site-specific integrase n=1 Tax=Caldanaerobacter subterraneus TaxID=911092 RepID=A0A7Y2L8P4_9THEO|nr:site-specific integrase [Caldanaerobacter subterraneus]NNG67727.1 site-specific integrase [Caldanaerobacter subterraneus]
MRGHITKRGSKWSIVIDVGRDENGKRKQKRFSGFKTKKEAEKALQEILYKLEKGELFLSKITLEEFLDEWYKEHCLPRLAPKTLKSYEELINLYFKPYLGNIELASLKPLEIQKYYNKLKELGLSNTTINYHHRVLRSALNRAVKWQYISKNPCDHVEPPSRDKKEMTVWSTADAYKAEEIFKDSPIYIHLILGLYEGLRVGEICGLKWEDIDFEKEEMIVRRQAQVVKGELIFREPKTEKSVRKIPLIKKVIDALKEEKRKQEENKLLLGDRYVKEYDGYISVWEDGRFKEPGYVSKKFHKMLLRHPELPLIRFHDLRHSCASLLVQAGVPMKIISKILGHSQIGITMDFYANITIEAEKEAIKKFEDFLKE